MMIGKFEEKMELYEVPATSYKKKTRAVEQTSSQINSNRSGDSNATRKPRQR